MGKKHYKILLTNVKFHKYSERNIPQTDPFEESLSLFSNSFIIQYK